MPGMYDRLTAKLGDDNQKPAGLSPLDIADLPEEQRQVMFTLLRNTSSETGEITQETLQEKLPDMANLPDVVAELTKNGWLVRLGELPNIRYRINLRHRRAGRLGANIWASLTDRLAQDQSEKTIGSEGEPSDQDADQPKPSFPALTDW